MISKHSWMMIMHHVGEAWRCPKNDGEFYDGRDDYGNFYHMALEFGKIVLYYNIEHNKHIYIQTASWRFEEFLKLNYMDFCNKMRELREQIIEGVL